MKRGGAILLLWIILLSGCGQQSEPILPTQSQTPTIVSTQTSAPTPTPTPTLTPTLTSVPTHTPETADSKVRARCREILAKYGATIDGIYAYINNKDPLERLFYNTADMPEASLPETAELAQHILDTGKGVCYHYSALTYYLLQEAGFEAVLITGARKTDGAPHRWTMVNTEDGWYHFDPQHYQKLLADEQKSSSTYLGTDAMEWDREAYPPSAKSFDEADAV